MTKTFNHSDVSAWIVRQNESTSADRSAQIAADIQKFLRDEDICGIGSSIDAELHAVSYI